MQRGNARRVLQVLLIRGAETGPDLVPVLWAAAQEVESLFALHPKQLWFDRVCITERKGRPDLPAESVVRLEESAWDELWLSARSRRARRLDQKKLVHKVRDVLGPHTHGARVILITDGEITPPSDWRYILWDGWDRNAVISTAPMDPVYWGELDDERVVTVKQRLRAACCSVMGASMGLKRCHNPDCFLYRAVDSVLQLDDMQFIGAEHQVHTLTGMGFLPSPDASSPGGASGVQPVGRVTTVTTRP